MEEMREGVKINTGVGRAGGVGPCSHSEGSWGGGQGQLPLQPGLCPKLFWQAGIRRAGGSCPRRWALGRGMFVLPSQGCHCTSPLGTGVTSKDGGSLV